MMGLARRTSGFCSRAQRFNLTVLYLGMSLAVGQWGWTQLSHGSRTRPLLSFPASPAWSVWSRKAFVPRANSGLSSRSPVITSKFKRWQKSRRSFFYSFISTLFPIPTKTDGVPHLNILNEADTAGKGGKRTPKITKNYTLSSVSVLS